MSEEISTREKALNWWNTLGENFLQRIIMQGELCTKYDTWNRKTSSLTGSEIEKIYLSEEAELNKWLESQEEN